MRINHSPHKTRFYLLVAFVFFALIVGILIRFYYLNSRYNLEKFSNNNFQVTIAVYDLNQQLEKIQSQINYLIESSMNKQSAKNYNTLVEMNFENIENTMLFFERIANEQLSSYDTVDVNQQALKDKINDFRLTLNNYKSLVNQLVIKYQNKDVTVIEPDDINQIQGTYKQLNKIELEILIIIKSKLFNYLSQINHTTQEKNILKYVFAIAFALTCAIISYLIYARNTKDLRHYIRNLKRKKSKLLHMSRHDPLTNLYNRVYFDETLERMISKSKRNNERFALLAIDLDNFKEINDTYGHRMGDLLLIEISNRLKTSMRIENIICRISGDEFSILIEKINKPQDAGTIAGQLLYEVNKPYLIKNQIVKSSITIGIANYPDSATTGEGLIKSADEALYHAKQKGKNSYQFFTPEIGYAHYKKLKIRNYLRSAIDNNEFLLLYQPIFSLTTNQIVAVEVTLRWQQPTLGTLKPINFIPIAEEYGYILTIGDWILKTACNDFKTLNDSKIKLVINVSIQQLNENFLKKIIQQIDEHNIAATQLEFDIQESSILNLNPEQEHIMKEIHKLGIGLTIDNFAKKHTSLTRVNTLPISSLKIAKALVRNENDAVLIQTILTIAQNFNFDVIAKGVETELQLNLLKKLNCPNAQGDYLSEPITIESVKNLCSKKI